MKCIMISFAWCKSSTFYLIDPAPTLPNIRSLLLSFSGPPLSFQPPSPSPPPQGLRGPSVQCEMVLDYN